MVWFTFIICLQGNTKDFDGLEAIDKNYKAFQVVLCVFFKWDSLNIWCVLACIQCTEIHKSSHWEVVFEDNVRFLFHRLQDYKMSSVNLIILYYLIS